MSDWTTDTGIHKNRLLTDSMASCIQSDWERILIVDDVQRNLDAMTTLLAEPDRVLLTAKSGMEALKLLQTTPVDLILLDVQMPGVTGFDTAELIRARPSLHEIPIIFVSAAATNDEYVSKGFAAGAYDYIVKPVQAEVLENQVRENPIFS